MRRGAAGQILVRENLLSQDEGWNRFAIIWDIAAVICPSAAGAWVAS